MEERSSSLSVAPTLYKEECHGQHMPLAAVFFYSLVSSTLRFLCL